MTLEEHVLAYLDGSLSEHESAELLHTLSASPEKRAVLDEHLRLNDMLALGRKPFAIPPSAEQELAARLPALGGAIENAPILRPSGFIAAGFQAARSFFADHAIITASAAGVLAVAGGLWWMTDHPVWNATRAEAPAMRVAGAAPGTRSNVGNANPSIERAEDGTLHAGSAFSQRPNGVRALHMADVAPAPEFDPAPILGQAEVSDAAIPFPGMRAPRTMHEIAFGIPRDGVHPYSIGVNALAGANYLPQLSGAAGTPMLAMEPQVTADYDLTESLALGLEAGFAEFGKLGTHFLLDPSIAGSRYSRGIYFSDIQGQSIGYVRASTHITIAPASEYPIRLGVAGGVAFESGMEPCVALSAGIARTLSDDLTLDLAFVASGVWSTATTDAVAPSALAGVTGIVHTETSATRAFTSAFGLRAGFRYRP